jgi:uncharacterized protein (TIRG00374 family)
MSVIKKQEKVLHEDGKPKTGEWLLFFILFVLASAIIFFYFAEIKKEIILLNRIHGYWLAAAVFAQFLTYIFTASIYRILLKPQQRQSPGLWALTIASLISLFISQTVPSAGISGNTFIFHFLAKYRVRLRLIASVVLTELLTSYAAMEILILFLLFMLSLGNSPEIFALTLVAGLVAYIFFGLIVSYAGRKKTLDFLFRKIKKVRLVNNVFEHQMIRLGREGMVNKDVRLLAFLDRNKIFVLKAFVFQLLVIAADGATIYALFYGLGIYVSAFVVLLCLICTRIVSLIPLFPGSLFLYESSMGFFFASLGTPLSAAIIVTLLFRLLSFWFPMPVGLLLYRTWLKKTPGLSPQEVHT